MTGPFSLKGEGDLYPSVSASATEDNLSIRSFGLAPQLRALADQPVDVQKRVGYADTLREICQQPATWMETARFMLEESPRLANFLEKAGVSPGRGALVLTGSGSSLYAGACVAPGLQMALEIPIHVIAAGDLLTHPASALPPTRPCLILSFARSGNSPESAAVVDQLLARDGECRHLLLTCCRNGRLAEAFAGNPRVFSLLLDDRTCDRSLVMTSSFTNMAIAASFLGFIHEAVRYRTHVESLSRIAAGLLADQADRLAAVAQCGFQKALLLVSGCRIGGAREAGLKLTEMSDGRVLSCVETYLGLRHGPMSAIHEDTLIVCFLSSDPTARAYEADLVAELNQKRLGMRKVLVGDGIPAELLAEGDVAIECHGMTDLGDESAAVLDVLVGQLLAFFHCIHLGLRPDWPSTNGVINRVVTPFAIYSRE